MRDAHERSSIRPAKRVDNVDDVLCHELEAVFPGVDRLIGAAKAEEIRDNEPIACVISVSEFV